MDRPCCKTCPHWRVYPERGNEGGCLAHPPSPVDLPSTRGPLARPNLWANLTTREDFGCGEHPAWEGWWLREQERDRGRVHPRY